MAFSISEALRAPVSRPPSELVHGVNLRIIQRNSEHRHGKGGNQLLCHFAGLEGQRLGHTIWLESALHRVRLTMHIALCCDFATGLLDDDACAPHIDAAHIACGAHAIAPEAITHSVALCARHGIVAGAGPGSVDAAGIGRRIALMTPEDIARSVCAQIAALPAVARGHVRLHGALNPFASTDPDVAQALADALAEQFPGIAVVAPAGGHLISAARRARLRALPEIAADRQYEPDGVLRGRSLPGAVYATAEQCADQILSAVRDGYVRAHDGSRVYLDAACAHVHATDAQTPARLAKIRRLLDRAGVRCQPPYSTATS
jgi:5-oxoprolinase (ATP-hydrolysing) subunit A